MPWESTLWQWDQRQVFRVAQLALQVTRLTPAVRHVCRHNIDHDRTGDWQDGANGRQIPWPWETVNSGFRRRGFVRRGSRHKRHHGHVSALCQEHARPSPRTACLVAQRGALGAAEEVLAGRIGATDRRLATADAVCRRKRRVVHVASGHVRLCARSPCLGRPSRHGIQQQQRRSQRGSQRRQRGCFVELADRREPPQPCELGDSNCPRPRCKRGASLILVAFSALGLSAKSFHRSCLSTHFCVRVPFRRP